jgi:hypothetical protein
MGDPYWIIMNSIESTTFEEDWILSMKKEILDDNKEKESFYNFDFQNERSKQGKYWWENLKNCEKLRET